MVRRRPRRGLVLMLVLTLLTLFALMAVTFVLTTGLYEDTSKAHAKRGIRHDPPYKLLDRALYDLVRDTNDVRSPIRLHSLLLDMYGVDARKGTLRNQRLLPDTGQQFIQYDCQLDGSSQSFDHVRGYYEGCVITFLTGPAKNLSTRIVYYDPYRGNSPPAGPPGGGPPSGPPPYGPTPQRYIIRFLVPKNDQGISVQPGNGAKFVINGRPFNGTGFGYNPMTGMVNAGTDPSDPTIPPVALLPNTATNGKTALYWGVNNGGDGDESYDAADFQNMFLAALIPKSTDENQIAYVVPSFHRPALVNYFRNQSPSNLAALARQFILRPLPTDHPNFTGSNPNANLRAPTNIDNVLKALSADHAWDVDNDGDGVVDSIWLDLGYPNMTDASGRTYRPLFAILCTDLDGRLNVNAHGNRWHLGTQPAGALVAGGQNTSNLAGGPGHGPPAVSLSGQPVSNPSPPPAQIFPGLGIDNNQYLKLLNLREGSDNQPGVPNFIDQRNFANLFDTPANYYMNPLATSFQSPPDLRDRLAVGLDHYGQPIYERTPEAAGTDLRIDLPYELDHSPDAPRGENSGRDALFSYGELERLLRMYDVDASTLPDRLQFLLSPNLNTSLGPANTRIVTTDSYDPPVPAIRYTRDMLAQLPPNGSAIPPNPNFPQRAFSFLDLLRFRLINGGTSFNDSQLDNEIAKMVPFDLRRGLRFDVNMPFGDGGDDTPSGNPYGQNIADEHGVIGIPGGPYPLEAVGTAELLPAIPNPTAPFGPGGNYVSSVPFHHLNGLNPAAGLNGNPFDANPNDNQRMLTRQLYARYLYVLLMTLSDPNAQIPEFDTNNDNATSPFERARGFAQWAINVVDFRDADSIMTPFEFDANPFNGWGCDGDIRQGTSSPDDQPNEAFVVWGCERPELLISETLAWHDRRTQDLNTEGAMGMGKKTTDMPNGDKDFDQRLRPRGSFFVELYNPWTSPSTGTPSGRGPWELYRGTPGVVLTNRAPPNPTSGAPGAPVWRLIVVNGTSHNQSADPDDPLSAFDPNDVERGIYFVNPGNSLPNNASSGHGKIKYFTDLPVAPVLPGRYAVLGSAHYKAGNSYLEPVGRLNDPTVNDSSYPSLMIGSTRRIVLTPNANPNTSNVQIVNNGTTEPVYPNIQHPVGIVINRPRAVSISEPATANGYGDFDGGGFNPAYPGNSDPFNNEGRYESGGMERPLDRPLDVSRTDFTGKEKQALLFGDGTKANFRTVYLQRLANPLLPFHTTLNPYRTIDAASVDLTSFNGVDAGTEPSAMPAVTPAPGPDTDLRFFSHERGAKSSGVVGYRALWRKEPVRADSDITATGGQTSDGTNHHFPYQLTHSLGRLNAAFGTAYTNGQAPPPYPSGPNLGGTYYSGAPNTSSAPAFPWLNWNNRPFFSGLELSQVPCTPSSRLLFRYSFYTGANAYLPFTPGPGNDGRSQFGHLMNFHQTGTGPLPGTPAANLHRLFEFVHVPSKFASSNTLLHPEFFTAYKLPNGMNNPRHSQNGYGTEQFHPPYNKVSNYRDPGRVNINTIYSERVWRALFTQGFGLAPKRPTFFGTTLPGWVDSRRGYGGLAVGQTQMNKNFPTLFANPLRSSGSSDLVPLANMIRPDVETTLLRRMDPSGASAPPGASLFDVPLSASTSANDINRNPFFRRQSLERLGNLVTSRSNVYAIWITVGFFEVNPNTQQLGRELGSETGNVQRHRAFYIVDRTIPVAFEPGKNHNVEKAIRLRRYIE